MTKGVAKITIIGFYLVSKELASEFQMKDLGLMHYFLGLVGDKDQMRSSFNKCNTLFIF